MKADTTPAGPAIPAESVDVDPVAVVRTDVQINLVAGRCTDRGTVERDARTGARLPGTRARLRVFALNRVVGAGGRHKHAAQQHDGRRKNRSPHLAEVVRAISYARQKDRGSMRPRHSWNSCNTTHHLSGQYRPKRSLVQAKRSLVQANRSRNIPEAWPRPVRSRLNLRAHHPEVEFSE